MIYNRDESEVAVLGEVQKHKVGIDERNINHIVTILSSNLYSYPMISFLREIVSNAVDSHIEAKSTEPIIIQRTATDISIRDFGTGISPERFEEIYLNIGSSTKRESNDYIGSFGIGRFSSLAVADLCNITSFYEGKAYYYVMNKDVDQLHIDLLDVMPTKEGNGVEVKVPLRSWDVSTLKCLAFIDNIYVETEVRSEQYEVSNFNKRKIHSYKNFKAIEWNFGNFQGETEIETEILLGKIPYRVDYRSLWDYSDDWHRSWEDCFKWIYPQIEIGQIDITPNREGLLYSERTKKVLQEAYDACIEELQELWNNACSKEYEDIKDYMSRITFYINNRLKLDGMTIPVSDKLQYNAVYKKYPEWTAIAPKEKKSIIQSLYNKEIDILCQMDGDTIYQGRRLNWFTLKKLLHDWIGWENKQVLALPSAAGFSSQYFKGFVTEKYGDNNKLFIRQLPTITPSYIKRFISKVYGITALTGSNKKFILQLLREVLQYVKKHIIVTDIIGSKEYEQYKKAHAIKKDRVAMPTEKICFTLTYCIDNSMSFKVTMTLSEIIPYCKGYWKNCQIVYAGLDNPFILAFKTMRYPNLVVISAAKNKMPLLSNNLPSWVKPIESLYNKDNRVLQKFAATRFIHLSPNIDLDDHAAFPAPIRDALKELRESTSKYLYWRVNSYDTESATSIVNIVPPEKWDIKLMALWNICKPWAELKFKLSNKLCLSSYSSNNYSNYYLLMKSKKFRMSWYFYNDIKKYVNNLLEAI